MPRKNSRVRRANDRDRRAREAARQAPKRAKDIRREPLEALVLPDGQCTLRPKARFATEEKAARALASAQRDRARKGSSRVEKRYYKCPEESCGGYHLTSRETYTERT